MRRLAAWLLPALIQMACFALWRELPFFAGAKKRNPKKAPLEAKPLESFSLESKKLSLAVAWDAGKKCRYHFLHAHE